MYTDSNVDPFMNECFDYENRNGTWGHNCLEGLCCSPCIYTFAMNNKQEYNAGDKCPFITTRSCCLSLCIGMCGNFWMPIVGCQTRSIESDESTLCRSCMREWVCGVCYCSSCAMAEHIRRKNNDPRANTGAGFAIPVVDSDSRARLL